MSHCFPLRLHQILSQITDPLSPIRWMNKNDEKVDFLIVESKRSKEIEEILKSYGWSKHVLFKYPFLFNYFF